MGQTSSMHSKTQQESKSYHGDPVASMEADMKHNSNITVSTTSSRDVEQHTGRKKKDESVQLTVDGLQKMFGKLEVSEDGLSLSVSISTAKLFQYLQEVVGKRKNIELRAEEVVKIAEQLKLLIEASKMRKNIQVGIEEIANTENQLEAPPQEKLEENKTVNITVLDPLPSGATKTFVKVLTVQLMRHGIRLVEDNKETFNDSSSTTAPVLLICNNHSRINSDIHNVVSEVKNACFHRIILLVLHCIKGRHLPTISAKEQLQESGEFQGFQDVLDIAFDKDLGIYDCNMNTNTIQSLEKLLKS